MHARPIVALAIAVVAIPLVTRTASSQQRAVPAAHERRIPAGKSSLYARDIGRGQPIIVLHGGPDFDSSYLLPDMDRFADGYRLIYYDQRGRGKSADGWSADDVSIDSEMEDLDRVRQSFHLSSAAVLGHSFGAILAVEYAIRHPDRVSHLILMNPAPVSTAGFAALRSARIARLQADGDLDRLRAAAATDAFKAGDPDAVAAYYRIHFKAALARPGDLDKVIASLRASFTPERVLKARAIEDRLNSQTISLDGYDLLPKAAQLRIPTLVVFADHDFIPIEPVQAIARAIPGAQMITVPNCGHFSYMECPADTRRSVDEFFRSAHRQAQGRPERRRGAAKASRSGDRW